MKPARGAPVAGLLLLALLALAAMALRLLIDRDLDGVVSLAWHGGGVLGLRLTAMATGAIVGVSLAVSGVMLQALLRNPLASPFILGVSAGAGLGVMGALFVNHQAGRTVIPEGGHMLPAMAGALGDKRVVSVKIFRAKRPLLFASYTNDAR